MDTSESKMEKGYLKEMRWLLISIFKIFVMNGFTHSCCEEEVRVEIDFNQTTTSTEWKSSRKVEAAKAVKIRIFNFSTFLRTICCVSTSIENFFGPFWVRARFSSSRWPTWFLWLFYFTPWVRRKIVRKNRIEKLRNGKTQRPPCLLDLHKKCLESSEETFPSFSGIDEHKPPPNPHLKRNRAYIWINMNSSKLIPKIDFSIKCLFGFVKAN